METHLGRALSTPSDKINGNSLFGRILPSNRYFEDYYYNLKFLYPLLVVGFTVNPELIPGMIEFDIC